MLTYSKLIAEDFFKIKVQDNQKFTPEQLGEISSYEKTDARTYKDETGEIIFIGGIVHKWHGSACLWAILSQDSGKNMIQLTREVKAWIATYTNYKRIEFYVDETFLAAKRWAIMLGFKCDGLCPAFLVNGNGAFIYSRIN